MTQRKLTYLERVPRRLHERLENWGRYYRPRRRENVSTIHEICEGMAEHSGHASYRDSYGPPERAEYRPPIDVEDARIIEWAWGQCAHRVHVKQRAMLRAYYVDEADPRLVCRVLQIRYLSFEDELFAAAEAFGVALAILESGEVAASL